MAGAYSKHMVVGAYCKHGSATSPCQIAIGFDALEYGHARCCRQLVITRNCWLDAGKQQPELYVHNDPPLWSAAMHIHYRETLDWIILGYSVITQGHHMPRYTRHEMFCTAVHVQKHRYMVTVCL